MKPLKRLQSLRARAVAMPISWRESIHRSPYRFKEIIEAEGRVDEGLWQH